METDNFKRFMTFSRGERMAIITIVSMIVIMLIIKYIIIYNPPKKNYFKHDLDSIIARREKMLDSIRRADSIAKVETRAKRELSPKVKKNSINANKVFSKKHNDTTQKGFIRQANAFASSGLRSTPLHSASVEMTESIDLNAADTTLLQQLPGIGAAYAKWIVDYREKLGGYCDTDQLLEVYRMDTNRFNGIERFVKIDSVFIPNQLRINSDSFKVLLKHPYLEYDVVKKIVNYREQKGMITSWSQLTQIIDDGINPKLRYYIDYQ